MPKFESSSSLGDSLSLPYFKVISDSKDFTFKPKFYNDSEDINVLKARYGGYDDVTDNGGL